MPRSSLAVALAWVLTVLDAAVPTYAVGGQDWLRIAPHLRTGREGPRVGPRRHQGGYGLRSRTVNWHLGSIYRKLGFHSRTEATRFAVEHSLL